MHLDTGGVKMQGIATGEAAEVAKWSCYSQQLKIRAAGNTSTSGLQVSTAIQADLNLRVSSYLILQGENQGLPVHPLFTGDRTCYVSHSR